MLRLGTQRRVALAASLCMALASCAGTSGVRMIGVETDTLWETRAPAVGGGPAAHDAVLFNAMSFCQAYGLQMQLLELRPGGYPYSRYWPTAFDAVFVAPLRQLLTDHDRRAVRGLK